MKVLFVNAAFREGSRTRLLADRVLDGYGDADIEEIDLGSLRIAPLDGERLAVYNRSVQSGDYSDPMFDVPKRFAGADEIVIAAPFWNYTLPAVLHDYLELVCTQGITFDISAEGTYYGKCRASKLTFVTTAGGPIPEHDHAFAYIRDLCELFWNVRDVRYVKADGLDIYGADVAAKLDGAIR